MLEGAPDVEDWFRLVAETAPVMLWMGDAHGKCVYLNKALRDFWGVAELGGFDWSGTVHPDDRDTLYTPFSKAMQAQTGFSVEARYRRADGVYRILSTQAQPRFGAGGEFLGMIGANADVTETRDGEAALRREKKLLEIVNHTGATVAAERDIEKVVQIITDAGVSLTGAQFGAFFYNVLDDKGGSYMLYSLSGAPREAFAKFPMPRATEVFMPTFRGEGVVRSDDILKDKRYGKADTYHGMPPGHLPVRSYLAVPVTSRSGEVLGGLFFGHAEAGKFTAAHETLLDGIAAHAATAIDNARLFQAAARELADRHRAEASLRAAKENRDFLFALGERQRLLQEPDAIMRMTAELLCCHMKADRAGFYRVSGTTLTFGPSWRQSTMPVLDGDSLDTTTLGEDYNNAARAGVSIVSADTTVPGDVGGEASRYGARAGIASPILRQGKWTSGVYVSMATPRAWTPEEVAFAEEVAETSWDNVERAQAEAALRAADARSRTELERLVGERTAALKASKARLRTIFETSYQYQCWLAPDGTLLDANSTSLHGIGCESEDVVGRKFWDTPWFSATPGMPELVKSGVEAAAGGQLVRAEIVVNLPTGRRAFDFSMRPVRDEDGRVVGIVPEATELTERRAAEEQLRQSQKMEAVGQLTGGIAHDFNNMLAVVIGGLNLLQRRLARGDTDVEKYVDAAIEGATRAAALTQRLLAFSRQKALTPEPVDAGRMVTGMTELLARTLGEHIRVETVLADGLWPIHADPAELESVVLNLSVNARDAMPDGGTLRVETANVQIAAPEAMACQVPLGDYVRIAVTDTGIGMAPDVVARAFDPFFTTKGVGKGTGLGLSQVFGFIRQSGGHVEIDSKPGRGTTVNVLLPRFIGVAWHAEGVKPSAVGVPDGKPSEIVLVVEDEERVRNYSVEALRELGYTVLQAPNGPAALKLIEDGRPVTLLFTDMVMPEMTGRELGRRATQKLAGLKVLYTTGYTRDAAAGTLDPGAAILQKPFSIQQLATKVRAVLDA
ncbi:MAG: PAS domain S-box protein [Rhizomicrobium sp.]